MRRTLAVLALLVAPEVAAQPAAPAAKVDWARGLVIVKTVGTADRRAPSPASARPVALREAEDRAAAGLLAAAKELPGAAGLADDVVAGNVVELATEFLPDGSVRIQRGLPIEAVRQALDGPRPVAPAWDGAPAAPAPATLVVDARNLAVTPRVGIAVSDGTTTARLPALWKASAPPPGAVKATGYDEATGTLTVDRVAAPDGGALLIVVIREKA
jgi:hypothetical protein